MTDCVQYGAGPASAVPLRLLWSDHVTALERHLSVNRWALAAATVVLISYPIARLAIPAALDAIVPEVVRTVLSLI